MKCNGMQCNAILRPVSDDDDDADDDDVMMMTMMMSLEFINIASLESMYLENSLEILEISEFGVHVS